MALRYQLARWDAGLGPVSATAVREARAAFDELDGIAVGTAPS